HRALVFPVHLKKFMKDMDKMPRGVHGFLVSNSIFSDQVVEMIGKQDRIFLTSEMEIPKLIKEVEKTNHETLRTDS
ncbi:31451_t:CDS:1, partial [Racocetra persica]